MPPPTSPRFGDGELPGPVADVDAVEPEPGGDDLVGDAELAIELQGPGLDGHGAGGLAGPGVLVDQAERCPGPRQPEGEDQPGRAGSDDQDLRLAHAYPPSLNRPPGRPPPATVETIPNFPWLV